MPTAGELYRLARLLREVALAVVADPDEAPIPLGLVLITDDIARHDGTTITEITARTGLAQSLVSKTVIRLRDAGVVNTQADPTDRRRTRITISTAARSDIFADRGSRTITRALQHRFPELRRKELTAVEAQLDQLIAALQP